VAVSRDAVGPGITFYEVLGALPTASTVEIRHRYDSKASMLRPELLAGASSAVVSAAWRAQEILDLAWWVLGDPARRAGYDEALGVRRTGEGLKRRDSVPSEEGRRPEDFGFPAGGSSQEALVLGGLLAVADFLSPHPAPPRRVTVPDVRGLFYSACLTATGRLGLRLAVVRLTENPMPVDGLVVDQAPRPQTKARRDAVLTVRVWHPAKTRA
jgi:curved DNA-binding protein CbpA